MNNIWRIFRDDARLAKSNIATVLVVLGLCLAPVIYAWFNIAGSWDPYGNTGQLKIAVANDDEGYESSLMPVQLNIGDRVVDALRDNDDYGWVFVGEDEALEGVRSGDYYAAIVIPGDFSSKMMSALSSNAERAGVGYYLNTKENPSASVLAGEGDSEAAEGIRAKFIEAVDEVSLGLAADLMSFANSDSAKDFGTRLVARLGDVADDLDDVAGQVRMFSGLVDATSSLTSATSKALSGSEDPADASGGVISEASEVLDAAIDSARSAASDIEQQIQVAKSQGELGGAGTETASKLVDDVDSLASSVELIAREADTVAQSLQDTAASMAGSTDSMSSDLDDMRDEIGIAANRLAASASKIRKFQDDVASALSRGNLGAVASIVGNNTSALTQWLAAPVQIEKRVVSPVENFGSSMAPFYTILSIWVGALVLVAVMKTGVSEERLRRYEEEGGRPVRNYEQYLGRYFTFVAIALLQATLACLGEMLFLHIQCVHPLLFLVACWACAIVFSNIIFTLAVSFGEIGKALCVVFLVMHVAGWGGGYPVQMMGDAFQVVNSLLPFAHGMRAMQASIAGIHGAEYTIDLLRLCSFLLPSLFLGLAIRKPVIRFAKFFDSKLKETGLM